MKNGSAFLSCSFCRILALVFCLGMMFILSPTKVYASDLDALIDDESGQTDSGEGESVIIYDDETGTSTNPFESSSDNDSQALVDALMGTQGISDESVAKASVIAQPVVAALNVISAFLLVVLMGSIVCITVLDLIFIAVPPLRGVLHPSFSQAGASGGMMPMQGGFGGFGRGYGMGMSGMAGSPQQSGGVVARQWVSDEAVASLGVSQPQAPQMGGMNMGMPGMSMQAQQQQSSKSVVYTYLKKRTFFLIVFAFAAVFLTSSIATGFGFKLFSFVQNLATKYL